MTFETKKILLLLILFVNGVLIFWVIELLSTLITILSNTSCSLALISKNVKLVGLKNLVPLTLKFNIRKAQPMLLPIRSPVFSVYRYLPSLFLLRPLRHPWWGISKPLIRPIHFFRAFVIIVFIHFGMEFYILSVVVPREFIFHLRISR